jgi:CheY-like chemotaxis protein
MDDLLVILVEDDKEIQGIIEQALTDGGFEPAIVSSGEASVTLLQGKGIAYRAKLKLSDYKSEEPLRNCFVVPYPR